MHTQGHLGMLSLRTGPESYMELSFRHNLPAHLSLQTLRTHFVRLGPQRPHREVQAPVLSLHD